MMRRQMFFALLLTPALSGPGFAGEPVVGQKDKQFSQEIVTVKRGDSVQFLNDDSVTHNLSVREPDGGHRPGVVQPPGGDAHMTFDTAGDNDVRCLIHPKMKMVVRVE